MTEEFETAPGTSRKTSWRLLGTIALAAVLVAFVTQMLILKSVSSARKTWVMTAATESDSPCSVIVLTQAVHGLESAPPRVAPWENGREPRHQIAAQEAAQRGMNTYRLDNFANKSLPGRRIAEGTDVLTIVSVTVIRDGRENVTHVYKTLKPPSDFHIQVRDDLTVSFQ